jgi:hypothetical protein
MTMHVDWPYATKPEIQCTGENNSRVCRHRHRRYGMSCTNWASLWARAGGRCEICRIRSRETSHGYLVIDHDYAYGFNGGAVRGLLCSPCNTRISYLANAEKWEAAMRYFARPWHLASGGSVTIPFTGIFDNGATDAPKEGG